MDIKYVEKYEVKGMWNGVIGTWEVSHSLKVLNINHSAKNRTSTPSGKKTYSTKIKMSSTFLLTYSPQPGSDYK